MVGETPQIEPLEPGVSAFVVFTTGEEVLRRCLESLQGAVDHIVAVDTGATDESRQIALELGAEVHDFPWTDSFADAYNFAASKVETEWTFWIDSDEWLLSEYTSMLRESIANPDAFAYSILRQDLYDEFRYSEMQALRLWRTTPGLRMIGAIHAQFPVEDLAAAAKERSIEPSPIRIRHDGFVGGASQSKLEQSIRLCRKQLAADPDNLYFGICLADSLCATGDPAGKQLAKQLANRVLKRGGEPEERLESQLLAVSLENMSEEEVRSRFATKHIEAIWEWFPRDPIAIWSVAAAERRRGNPEGEMRALLRLEEMGETNEYDRFLSFDPGLIGPKCWANLALVAFEIEEDDIARRNFEKMIRVDPSDPVPHEYLKRIEQRGIQR